MSSVEQEKSIEQHPVLRIAKFVLGATVVVAVGVKIIRTSSELLDGLSMGTGFEHTVPVKPSSNTLQTS